MWAFAQSLSWGQNRKELLKRTLSNFLAIPIGDTRIHHRWAELHSYSRGQGTPLQHDANDTLKENTLKRADLDDFVKSYNPKNHHNRKESDRFNSFGYDDLIKRDKANLDIFWLKDDSLEDSANLPDPDVLAQEIVDDLETALEQFATIAEDLKK